MITHKHDKQKSITKIIKVKKFRHKNFNTKMITHVKIDKIKSEELNKKIKIKTDTNAKKSHKMLLHRQFL